MNQYRTNGDEQRIGMFNEIMQGAGVGADLLEWLVEAGFFSSPASIMYHSNYEGGLFDHSYAVTKQLLRFTEKLPLAWEDSRSPKIIGMFHDLCKVGLYVKVTQDGKTNFKTNKEYNPEISGHGECSVARLERFVELTEEEKLCIHHHMGAFVSRAEWKGYSDAVGCYQNVLWTHTADMYASNVLGA